MKPPTRLDSDIGAGPRTMRAGGTPVAAGIADATLVELPGAAHILNGTDRATWLRHVRQSLGGTR
ncbi:hypothetical protein [Actinopolymorpha rutila]|uniref:Alpha/beta hydrolase family protein n=1 Tax=Actinopolymorpha rutila TaxID=446787 RepID=A0A852Z5C7_9ACTN|nr:hypothetical protein [Actinopolymorpha rutila]NYH88061.1 hypothetical protein [Actinopolymorpha rutila]